MAYCIKCGAELEPGARFCAACGAAQDSGEPQVRPAYGTGTVSEPWDLTPKKKSGKKVGVIVSVVVLAALVLGFIMAALGGDGDSLSSSIVTLVQGNLDELYLGSFDKAFMEMVGCTESQCQQIYLDGLQKEVDFFVYYWNIEYPTDALKDELLELYKEIYSHSKYTVGECSKLDEDTYAVKLDVYPIDVMEQVESALAAGGMDWFYEKYPDDVVSAMTQEAYEAYDQEWAQGIVDLVREKLPGLGYGEPQSRAIQVIRDDDGLWVIEDGDMGWIDSCMITYP